MEYDGVKKLRVCCGQRTFLNLVFGGNNHTGIQDVVAVASCTKLTSALSTLYRRADRIDFDVWYILLCSPSISRK
jgi:hypothetical protein